MDYEDFVQLTSDPDGEGYFAEDRSIVYCKHGHYVGYPGGPDYICPHCEDGHDTLFKHDYWHLVLKEKDGHVMYGRDYWNIEALTLAVRMFDDIINGPASTHTLELDVITDDWYFWGRGDDPDLQGYTKVRKV